MIRGEPKAGVMHCVIFTGFLILLASAFCFNAGYGTWVRARLEPHLTPAKRATKKAGGH